MIKRRYFFNIEIGGDDWSDITTSLRQILFDLERPENEGSERVEIISGGPTAGYIITSEFDPNMTHDKYFDLIREASNQSH